MNDETNELHASGAFYASFLPARLTAIIPHYNHADVLPRALAALQRSTRPPDEVIVVDDFSSPDQWELARDICRNLKVRFITQHPNLGVPATLNNGIENSTGNLLYFGSADDEVFPNFFEQALNTLKRYPAAGLVAGMGEWVSNGKRIEVGYPRPAYFEPARVADKFVPNHVAVYRKSPLVRFKPEAGPFADWLLAQEVTQAHGACFTGSVGGRMNLNGASYYNRRNPGHAKFALEELERRGLLGKVRAEVLGPAAYELLPAELQTLRTALRFVLHDIKARTWRNLPQPLLDAWALVGGRAV